MEPTSSIKYTDINKTKPEQQKFFIFNKPSESAIGVHMHSQSFHVIGSICPPTKVCQVELNLNIKVVYCCAAVGQTWFHPSSSRNGIVQIKDFTRVAIYTALVNHIGSLSVSHLVVRSAKPSAHAFVVQDLDFEGEVLVHLQLDVGKRQEQRHLHRRRHF